MVMSLDDAPHSGHQTRAERRPKMAGSQKWRGGVSPKTRQISNAIVYVKRRPTAAIGEGRLRPFGLSKHAPQGEDAKSRRLR